jgi:c-di-GMP-binding flagellar brake protein YcgR
MVKESIQIESERRRHSRFAMNYPARLYSRKGQFVAESQTLNISQRGALMAVPAEALSRLNDRMNITISLPQDVHQAQSVTSFACEARMVRSHADSRDEMQCVALEFTSPIILSC